MDTGGGVIVEDKVVELNMVVATPKRKGINQNKFQALLLSVYLYYSRLLRFSSG